MRQAIGRRTILAAAGAAFAAAQMPAHAATAGFDPGNPADVTLALRKLRYRLDDGLVFWWIVASKYIQVGASLTAMCDMHVGTVMRIKNEDGGAFSATSLETVFYTDTRGALLKEWSNPYTGAVLQVPTDMVGPVTMPYHADGTRVIPSEIGGAPLEADVHIGPVLIAGDEMWVRDDSTARVLSRDGVAPPFVVNDWATYNGKVSDVRNKKVTSAAASVTLQEVTGFQRWMQMGDTEVAHTGSLFTRGVGRKVSSYTEMPAIWRGLLAAQFPDIARELAVDAHKALDRPQATFDR